MLAKQFGCPAGRPDDYGVIITGPSLLVPMDEGIPNVQTDTAPEGGEQA
jgi:hypothetical protein